MILDCFIFDVIRGIYAFKIIKAYGMTIIEKKHKNLIQIKIL